MAWVLLAPTLLRASVVEAVADDLLLVLPKLLRRPFAPGADAPPPPLPLLEPMLTRMSLATPKWDNRSAAVIVTAEAAGLAAATPTALSVAF